MLQRLEQKEAPLLARVLRKALQTSGTRKTSDSKLKIDGATKSKIISPGPAPPFKGGPHSAANQKCLQYHYAENLANVNDLLAAIVVAGIVAQNDGGAKGH